MAFAGRFGKCHSRRFAFQPGESRALLIIAVLLGKIAQEMLQVNQVCRVLGQTLREQIVRIFEVSLLGAPLGVLENSLQTLAHGWRYRRQALPLRTGWLLSRHEETLPEKPPLARYQNRRQKRFKRPAVYTSILTGRFRHTI
ncbi:MAG TPA: hypothetical protein VGK58_00045 [Lacipirellulaceae bacterium]